MPKIFLNYEQQIYKLRMEKKLQVSDVAHAKEVLQQISYYSLIGGYKDGTRFENIEELYYFDESLRHLFLKYLMKVENEMKSQISYYFTEEHGEKQEEYLDRHNYNYLGQKNRNDIDALIRILDNHANKSTNYAYINHARKKYGNVPLWVLMNALTFGNVSKMYMLLPQNIQIKVSRNYQNVNESQMVSVLAVLIKFRNVCAHGERLFTYRTRDSIPDFSLHKKLGIAKKGTQYERGKNDLFAVLIALRYLLGEKRFKEFMKELRNLTDGYLKIHGEISETELLNRMGFPRNWKKITRYKKI